MFSLVLTVSMECFSERIEFMSYWLVNFIGLMDVSERSFV